MFFKKNEIGINDFRFVNIFSHSVQGLWFDSV